MILTMKNLNFLQKKWYYIESQTPKSRCNQSNSIKFETESIKSSLCDYFDAFILVTWDRTVAAKNNAHVAFKNCAPFSTCKTEINNVFVDEANHIYTAMPMYNLIEYSDNYLDTSGSLCQFKRDKNPANNVDLSVHHSQSFKYKAALVRKTLVTVNNAISSVKNTKFIVSIKYISNFWRSLEMPMIKCKIHIALNWNEDCILSSDGDSVKFKIMDAKLDVPIATLFIKGNINLAKQLNDGFKRFLYWNNYQTVPAKVIERKKHISVT